MHLLQSVAKLGEMDQGQVVVSARDSASRAGPLTLVGVAFALLVYLTARDGGLYGFVFSDEWLYSFSSRLWPLASAPRPNYLYYGVFRATNVCGDGFLNCARLLNAAFFAASAIPIYLSASRFTSPRMAMYIVVLSVFGAVNIYATYFMPESMYWFLFWVLLWVVMGTQEPRIGLWCTLAGFVLGLMALVKPQAIFLLPSLFLYRFIAEKAQDTFNPIWRSATQGATIALAFAGARFGVGLLLAGPVSLSYFGVQYGSIAGYSLTLFSTGLFYKNLLVQLGGNLLGIALLYSVPIALILLLSIRRIGTLPHSTILTVPWLVAIAFFSVLVPLASFFGAVAADTGPYESALRIGARFYDFAFPIFLMLAAGALALPDAEFLSSRSRLLCASVVVFLALAACVWLPVYNLIPNDAPEFWSIAHNKSVLWFTGILTVGCLSLWVLRARAGTVAFLVVLAPLTTVLESANVAGYGSSRKAPNDFDRAALFAKSYLGDDVKDLVVASPELAGIYNAMFVIDDPSIRPMLAVDGKAIDKNDIPPHSRWLLTIGPVSINLPVEFEVTAKGFSLRRLISE